MTATTLEREAAPQSRESRFAERYTLDDLARMNTAELEACYRNGSVPESLRVLDGSPASRMLAVVGLQFGPVPTTVRRVAAAGWFPWRGKSFKAITDDKGTGINRVRLAFGVRDLFGFDTRIEPSAVDGKPCILLDYDKPNNPRVIRAIRDELREVSPGVFLGPAMLQLRGGSRLFCHFAVDTNRSS
ncbi:MAG: hypothetical protein HYV63_15410 [Candidatus Schekmanbacteria bacterium]|nr:hypothetical protein [Candidatus Schekmanbacteria bacterium]